jgi:hypothetical protein
LLEESLCVFHVMQTYDEPKDKHEVSLMGRTYYMQKQIGMFHPEELVCYITVGHIFNVYLFVLCALN